MNTRLRAGFASAVILLAGPCLAWGACPAPGAICAEYARATLVFVADVETIRVGGLAEVQFRIVERLKGSLPDHMTLALEPSSEEFAYIRGQRVLVYAVPGPRFKGLWSTACTRTKVISATDTEPASLRTLRDGRAGGVIDGDLATAQLLRANRAGDVQVVVQRGADTVQVVQTDRVGRFQTGWLAPGSYVLSARSSQGKEIRHDVVVSREPHCISLGSIALRQAKPS